MEGKPTEFRKTKEFLICIDSDGCAIDTMDLKHRKSFAPCTVYEWGLEEYRDAIQKRWREISLYSMDRGVNRFIGLAKILKDINENYKHVEDLDSLLNWVQNADELSNDSLKREIERTGSPCLKKVLDWSELVNGSIRMINTDKKVPFDGVREALEKMTGFADIAIVTAANEEEIRKEWVYWDMMEYVEHIYAQEAGSKASTIHSLMSLGYAPDHILMIGDAPADLKAAQENGVLFYPINVREEKQCWEEFRREAANSFRNGIYAGRYQDEKITEFYDNLAG